MADKGTAETSSMMETDWAVPVSIAVGGFTVLTAAGVASATALYIHWRKRKDDCIKQVKDRMDAHRTVWHALRQIEADEERKTVEAKLFDDGQHVIDVSGIPWLRDYFRDNAALLAPSLHDAYEHALGNDIRFRSAYQTEFEKDIDLPEMISIAKKELDAYEQRYRDMGGFDPRERR